MNDSFRELDGLHVTVDRILYTPDLPSPPDQPFSFIYFISIRNNSDVTVTIKGRKWVVRDTAGNVTAVEGDGVVGEFPTIPPGERFSYNSRHVLATPSGEAEGSYIGLDENGNRILVRIPRFEMNAEVDDSGPMWA
ncbi:MAG: ApaG domain [Verrucomicrobiae bacterium]|jgi:ApaG protein|nr:ApaG domain [Verrucomicrobiae bacterium]